MVLTFKFVKNEGLHVPDFKITTRSLVKKNGHGHGQAHGHERGFVDYKRGLVNNTNNPLYSWAF